MYSTVKSLPLPSNLNSLCLTSNSVSSCRVRGYSCLLPKPKMVKLVFCTTVCRLPSFVDVPWALNTLPQSPSPLSSLTVLPPISLSSENTARCVYLCCFFKISFFAFVFYWKKIVALTSERCPPCQIGRDLWKLRHHRHQSETLQHCTSCLSPVAFYSPPPPFLLDLYSSNWGSEATF